MPWFFCLLVDSFATHLSSSCCDCGCQALILYLLKLDQEIQSRRKRSSKNKLTLRLMNFKALLSLPILSNSITLFSYGCKPETSRIKSLTNLACLLC